MILFPKALAISCCQAQAPVTLCFTCEGSPALRMSQTINLSKHPIYFTSDTEHSLQYCTNKILYKQVLCWALSHTWTACGKAWTVFPASAALQWLELERENKHLCSTCTTKHFLRVTWLQLPMTDCYTGLILKTYHHLMIFFLFFFFPSVRVRRGEGILFLTRLQPCSCLGY